MAAQLGLMKAPGAKGAPAAGAAPKAAPKSK